ncbi:MAG: hypothetical protein WCK48_01240 [bacterium]
MKENIVIVHDKMQKNYRYKLSEPEGKNFDARFKPDLTPKQMLQLGVFGGVYMRDCTNEFPKQWFVKVKFAPNKRDKNLNFFKVNASQSLSVWRRNGWIYADDPRGWFQWYCRYYAGRRIPDEDERQINRWSKMRRHIAQIAKHCRVGDTYCRPRQRQALLHWAYDARNI